MLAVGIRLSFAGQQLVLEMIDGSSFRPVGGLAFSLIDTDSSVVETETDSDGRAILFGLPYGDYRLHLDNPAYADVLAQPQLGREINISPDRESPIVVVLTRTSTISGEVRDSLGKPVQGVDISAVVRRRGEKNIRLTDFGYPTRTDDRGQYRLHGLPPGHYSVVALPTSTRTRVLAPVYYGASSSRSHVAPAFFQLKPGEDRTGVDLTISFPQSSSISGTVSGALSNPNAPHPIVALLTRAGAPIPVATVRANRNGSYQFSTVAPGDYIMMASTAFDGWDSGPRNGQHARSASRHISVSGNDVEIDMNLEPVIVQEGQTIWDATAVHDSSCAGNGQLRLRSADGWADRSLAVSLEDGTRFVIDDLPSGRFRVDVSIPQGPCHLDTVFVGGQLAPRRSVLLTGSEPLTLILSTSAGALSGLVHDASVATTVVLLSEDVDDAMWAVPTDSEGHYRFSAIPPGRYLLFCLLTPHSVDFLDPLFHESATPIRIVAGVEQRRDIEEIAQ
jgi:hypothetical protein